MSSKEEYKLKIDELQGLVQDKSRELQKENEKFDSLMINKNSLLDRISELNGLIVLKEGFIKRLDQTSVITQKDSLKRTQASKKHLLGLKKVIAEYSGIDKQISSKLKKLNKARDEVEKLDIRRIKIEKSLNKTRKSLNELNKELSEKKRTRDKEDIQLDKMRTKLIEDNELLKKQTSRFNMRIKNIQFYARRLARIYRKKRMALPSSTMDIINNLNKS